MENPVSDEPNQPSPDPSQPSNAGPYSQQIQQTLVSARLPDRVAAGIFSSGVIVMEGADEFVLDFVQGLSRPPRVGARVVVSPNVMSQLVGALKENLARYEQSFGAPKPVPKPNMDAGRAFKRFIRTSGFLTIFLAVSMPIP